VARPTSPKATAEGADLVAVEIYELNDDGDHHFLFFSSVTIAGGRVQNNAMFARAATFRRR
jgi:hypothetical protein